MGEERMFMCMKDFLCRFEQGALILALMVGLAACNGNIGTTSPVIITQPVNCTVEANQTASFSVTAIGGGLLMFQWQQAKAASPGVFTDMAGETSSVLNFKVLSENNGDSYRVVVTNSYGSVTSSAAVLTVKPTPTPQISVSISPAAANVVAGGSQLFTATVTNSSNLAVAWSISEGKAGGEIDSSGKYTAPSTAGTYHVVATSLADITKSASATVTVAAAPLPQISVSVSPAAANVAAGGTQTFTATVENTANLAVIWSISEGKAGGDIDSSGKYTAPQTPGTYHVIATSLADLAKSASAEVTVTAPVTVNVSPGTVSMETGCAQLFTADVANTSNKTVNWSVMEGSMGGVIDDSGLYTAPDTAGTYHIIAKSAADPSGTAIAEITVSAPATVDGIDWWLPQGIKMASFGGLISQWCWNDTWSKGMLDKPYFKDGKPHLTYMIWASWKSLNPQEGVYDWQAIDSQITRANTDPGIGFSLIITQYKKDLVPQWVLDKGVKTLSNGAVAAWESGNYTFQNCYRKFIWELAGRYKNNPKLISLDIRGLDVNWGEWGWSNDPDGKVWQEGVANTGLSWDAINTWAKQHVTDYMEAFKGQEYKLVWPSQLDELRPTWEFAFSKGIGTRDGFVEAWNLFVNTASGMQQTTDGYLEPRQDYLIFNNGAMSYSENEEYYNTTGYFGPPEYNDIRWFTSCMRVLQLRRNWMMGRDMMYDKFPEFTDYLCLSLGKTAKTTPDAWVWLRESYPAGKVQHLFKNFERWLVQRDIKPNGVTKTADPIDVSNMGFNYFMNSYKQYEYQARSTDMANGSPYMYFRADTDYLTGGPYDLIAKVTYKDDTGIKWRLEYTGTSGKPAYTATVSGTGGGGWKTATLKCTGIRFDKSFQNMDFRLESKGNSDVTVKMVRIVNPTHL